MPGVSAVHAALCAGASPRADIHLALISALHPARGWIAPRAKVVGDLEITAPAAAPPPAAARHTHNRCFVLLRHMVSALCHDAGLRCPLQLPPALQQTVVSCRAN